MDKPHSPEIDRQIQLSLERISEAFRVLLWEQSKATGLSPIQIQLLIFISSHSAEKCKVTYLADEFNLTKATVSDSVKVLINKGLLVRTIDPGDSRSFSMALTPSGKDASKQVGGFNAIFGQLMGEFSIDEKNSLYSMLHRLIKGLNYNGVISVQRNCSSCSFYNGSNGKHHCGLIKSDLTVHQLRIDCDDHVVKK